MGFMMCRQSPYPIGRLSWWRPVAGILLLWLAGFMITIPHAQAFTQEAASLDGLHGTLAMPAISGAVPVVLILAGSGPVDRDGNLPGMTNNGLRLLAQALAGQGIASLRIDKRGVGQSAAVGLREADLRFQTYVDDTRAWAAWLERDPRFGPVFLLGHSEGALVATLAAQGRDFAGLILLAGAGQPAAQAIARQLAAAGVDQALQDASRRITDDLLQGRVVTDVPPALMALYRPGVQGYMMSWLPLYPAAELARTTLPVLILQGTTDLQITPDDARLLHQARPDAGLILIEGMNHVLKPAPVQRLSNLQTYAMPDLPLAEGLVVAIQRFISGR